MQAQSGIVNILLSPVRLVFSSFMTVWWAVEWIFLAVWHLFLFIILADRLDLPEQFTRHAQRKLHEQGEALRFVWGR